jgi:hypothetical protein
MLMQPTSGKGKVEKIIDIRKVQSQLGGYAVKHLLVLHAIGGCDTTSALYGNGKVNVLKKVMACTDLAECLQVMGDVEASHEQVGLVGRQMLAVIYGGKFTDSLNCMRHTLYMKMCASSTGRPVPERLPPTENAAYFHSLRVHLQVIQWLKLSTDTMTAADPVCWGWTKGEGGYEPIAMQQEPAPPELLKVIRCTCKSDSRNQCGSNACTCRRNGLTCVSACGKCHGTDCLNTQPAVVGEVGEDVTDGECESLDDGDGFERYDNMATVLNDDDVDWLYEEVV